MELRIGINVGDVLVDGGNLYGDGVNIAARLESIATPGNICISGSVYSLVKNKLSYGFEDIGLQTVKNIPEPVSAFRLTSSVAAPRAVQSSKRLMAAGAVLALLLVVGVGAWTWRVFQSGGTKVTSATGIEREAPSDRAGASPVSPDQAGKEFDGIWEFRLAGGQYCLLKSLTFRRKILDGAVVSDAGKKLGSVSKDGSFHFSNPSPMNPNVLVQSQGIMKGETGEGRYLAVGTPCQGTYEIRLVERL